MLISYPILPTPSAGDGESELDAFIRTYVDTTAGLYPVSFKDRWHGGIHLHPGDAPIRAIADGEVVAYRIAPIPETYKKQDFDTSFVLLKHTTETGENTPLVFYSLYMHLLNRRDLKDTQLKQIVDWLRKTGPSTKVNPGNSQRVWRKDILGFGGQLYGDRHVHFEVFAPNIDAFWKDSDALSQGANGSPDFFGNAGFVLPTGTHFLAAHPNATQHKGKKKDSTLYVGSQEEPLGVEGFSGGDISTNSPVPIDSFLDGVGTEVVHTDGRLFVVMGFDKGTRTATSYQINAQNEVEQVGPPVEQENYEYNLYSIASALYADCPSAGYEWLRYGRILGQDSTNQQHNWQFLRYGKDTNAVGYVDLAADNITKISDADFPFWQGWKLIDESKAVIQEDGICDVPALQALLNIPADKQGQSLLDPPGFATKANDPVIAKKLRHLICKFNSEWDDSDIDQRYQRWYQQGQPLEDPDSQKDFKDHVKKMAFWSNTNLERSVWHFHPLQFIEHYRKCGWLTKDEVVRCIRKTIKEGGKEVVQITSDDVINRLTNSSDKRPADLHPNFQKMIRKYGISSNRVRLAHLFGQLTAETGRLEFMLEGGKPSYFDKYEPGTAEGDKLGNTQPGDGARFKGRGLIQLTGRTNYENYGAYRNATFNTDATSSLLLTDAYDTCDASGYYWSSKQRYQYITDPTTHKKKLVPLGQQNINYWADRGASDSAAHDVTKCINPQQLGFDVRYQGFENAIYELDDEVSPNQDYKPTV